MKIPAAVERRIAELLHDAGINADEQVILNHLNMTNAPPDAYLTEAALRRAEHEAKHIDEKYYCYMCGKKYDKAEDFVACMHDHILDFFAAKPPVMEPEHMEKVIANTPEHMRDHIRDVLTPNEEKKE